jgi:hypothetical protein
MTAQLAAACRSRRLCLVKIVRAVPIFVCRRIIYRDGRNVCLPCNWT